MYSTTQSELREILLFQIRPNPFPSATSLAPFPHRHKPKSKPKHSLRKKERGFSFLAYAHQLTPPNFFLWGSSPFHWLSKSPTQFSLQSFNGCFNQLLGCKVGGFVAEMWFLQCCHHHHSYIMFWQKQKDTCSESERGYSL